MAFAGLKKQINKANQYVTEKMGGAEGTQMDEDFTDMEKKTDVTYELVEELQIKTKEFLQPNPTARAKMAAVKGISKLSGQAKASTYPQPEGVLGECMVTYGRRLGDDSLFGSALCEMGESMKQMADVKYSLDDNIKQNFLEPLHHLQTKDLKEVMHHRKKLQGRRLDFDCKRRRQAKDEEIKMSEEKFAESLQLAQIGMHNLLENDIEQISQLATFAEALLDYHQQCVEILRSLTETLLEKKQEAANRPKSEFVPKTLHDLHVEGLTDGLNGSSLASSPVHPKPNQLELFPSGNVPRSANASPLPSPMRSPARSAVPKMPCCTALYDFEPENPGELGFKEGETITLTNKIDENWYEGTVNGRTGYFPVTYVQVIVPLP
ncbi:endophilin-A isoform X6 [Schistocerca gregaria]|uniref:endophilin-A isoform X6 n=1 Tax=Schistocerca gregaria TaxID=7010 RepID=UPI00211DF6D5|nr:endophilin-A isoform X6 [Schistocerca gregaria]XP_049837137.1 endophilin-A isoform X6 [Schistocerca gregaria]XP_049837138.1 endophilin-A isoform X6 [Schistocerca gregaria]XP_049837139.1 endophilin-A isoform X6 [Schistocerca gregaria]